MSSVAQRQRADFEARVAALEARVQALETRRGLRTVPNVELRRVLAHCTWHPETQRALPFTISQLQAHAAVVPALARALANALLESPREIACWLRDQQGDRDGVTIERLRRRRWLAYMSDISSVNL